MAAHPPAQGEAALVGKAQLGEDEPRAARHGEAQRLGPGRGLEHREAVANEVLHDRAAIGVVRVHDERGAQRDGRALERSRSVRSGRLLPRAVRGVDRPRGRRRRLGRGRRPDDVAEDGVEALEEPARLPRPGEELHHGEAARRGRLRGQVVHPQRHDREAGRGRVDVQRAQHGVPVRQGRRDAAEGGVPAAALPLGNGLEAAEAEVDEDEVDGGHRGHARGGGGVLRHEDPVVLATENALGGKAVDRVGFEDHDTPCIRQRSLPTLNEAPPSRAGRAGRGMPRRRARPRTAAQCLPNREAWGGNDARGTRVLSRIFGLLQSASRAGVLPRDGMRILARRGAGERRSFCRPSGRKTDRTLSRRCHSPAAALSPRVRQPAANTGDRPVAGPFRRRRYATCVRFRRGPRGRAGEWTMRTKLACVAVAVLAGACGGEFESPAAAPVAGLALVSVQPAVGAGFARPRASRRLRLVHDGLQRRAVGRLALDPARRQPVARRLVGRPPLPLLAARLAGGRLHPRRRPARHGGLPPGRDRVRAALRDRPHRRPRPLRRHPRVPGVVEREPQLRGVSARRRRAASQSGRAKATYASPDRVPIFPPPAAITTYCRPSFSYVAGVA